MRQGPGPVLSILDPSLVLLIGVAGSGKSTFAGRHFTPGQVLSSDYFRFLVSGDATDQSASEDAFEALHLVTRRRLARRLLTVIDATNLERDSRAMFLRFAREAEMPCLAIVLDLPVELCRERNRQRAARVVDPAVIAAQSGLLQCALAGLDNEGFHRVYVLASAHEVERVRVALLPGPAA